ncbi:MAG: hypothetical protein AAGF99_00435 [Bacteroidota bacterium]
MFPFIDPDQLTLDTDYHVIRFIKETVIPRLNSLAGYSPDGALVVPGLPSYSDLDKDVLVDLADERKLEVTRADGKDGEPLKSDYVAALAAADAAGAEETEAAE